MHIQLQCDIPEQACEQCESIEDSREIDENYVDYLRDESRFSSGRADRIFFPRSECQVQKILLRAQQNRIPLTFSSGRTGIVAGAVPNGGWLVSFEKMNRILHVDWHEMDNKWLLTLEPGVSLTQLAQFLDSNGNSEKNNFADKDDFLSISHRWFYPPDPTEKTAHLGGTVATNASGSRSFFYGSTRNHIHGLRVLLANGAILKLKRGEVIIQVDDEIQIDGPAGMLSLIIPPFHRRTLKNTAGYYLDSPMDLIDLFIGSEGTLGIITQITIALSEKPDSLLGGVVFFKMEQQAIGFVEKLRQVAPHNHSPIKPISLEFFDARALKLLTEHHSFARIIPKQAAAAISFEQPFEDSSLDEILSAFDSLMQEFGTSMDETWGAWDSQSLTEMNTFRHTVPEQVNAIIVQRQRNCQEIYKVSTDFVVPDQFLKEIMQRYRSVLQSTHLESVLFGHIGENHLHINLLPKDKQEIESAKSLYRLLAKDVIRMRGSLSGEHGIGKLKRELLKMMYSSKELETMKAVKRALDPSKILSPGNLFSSV